MKRFVNQIFLLSYILAYSTAAAQLIPVNDHQIAKTYPFFNPANNHISRESGLDSFFQKLISLKKNKEGTISIVHIGDSHIQADYFTSVIRKGLQQFFGDAGRGLIFPYQLAQSNTPPDITSSSNTTWEFNRLAHPEIPINSGISGYCIRTNFSGASIELGLKPDDINLTQSFNRLKFFLGSNPLVSWMLRTNTDSSLILINGEKSDSMTYPDIVLKHNASSFILSSLLSDSLKEFYGVSLENSEPGIIYHTIGVNGATYNSFNSGSLFWQQLPALQADLYIISLGTNEAQKVGLDRDTFLLQLDTFFSKLKQASPGAAVMVTTTADDFYKRHRPNKMLKQINSYISSYCNTHKIPLWDLYQITGGHGSAYKWLKRGLMNKDRVHFTNEGYRMQGSLFFNAFSKAYNKFLNAK